VYTILFVPRATELCRKVLEDEGVAGDVTIGEVSQLLYWLARTYDDQHRDMLWADAAVQARVRASRRRPLVVGDGRRCSRYILGELHIPQHSLRQVRKADKQKGDETAIYYSSLALMTFQRAFGLFPRIMGKGDGAQVSGSAHSWSKSGLMGILLTCSEIGQSAQTPSCVRCHPI
jgi:hypothetical protein